MSYITDKYHAGEVHIENGVHGWLFDSGEHRPLMEDAMSELYEAGLCSAADVVRTRKARDVHTAAFLAEYIKSQEEFETSPEYAEARAERDFEMRAAFGPGEEVVNVFTGRRYRT